MKLSLILSGAFLAASAFAYRIDLWAESDYQGKQATFVSLEFLPVNHGTALTNKLDRNPSRHIQPAMFIHIFSDPFRNRLLTVDVVSKQWHSYRLLVRWSRLVDLGLATGRWMLRCVLSW